MIGDTPVAPAPPPQVGALAPMLSIPRDTAAEAHVTIDTHGSEIDVRQLLAFLAEKGRLSLVYSPDVNRKVRVQLVDVPVSEALTAVLSLAGLTLEGSGPRTRAAVPSVVFYQLPINIDSLSVDAIMKRFGVGRSIAELLVQARTNVP